MGLGLGIWPSFFFGFLASFWTHNVYVGPAIFCTLQYGILWNIESHRNADIVNQMDIHVTQLLSLYLGVFLGTYAFTRRKYPVLIDVNFVRNNQLTPIFFLNIFSFLSLYIGYLLYLQKFGDTLILDDISTVSGIIIISISIFSILLTIIFLQFYNINRIDLKSLCYTFLCCYQLFLYYVFKNYGIFSILLSYFTFFYLPIVILYVKNIKYWSSIALVHSLSLISIEIETKIFDGNEKQYKLIFLMLTTVILIVFFTL